MEGLEKGENYCEKLDISMVKINDLELVRTRKVIENIISGDGV